LASESARNLVKTAFMSTLKLGHIELFVRDPARSRDFYRDVLGFEVVAEQGDQHIWLKSGEIEILLRPGIESPTAKTYQDARVGFVMYTDDLLATLSRLKESGLTPRGQDGSSKCPTFADPDGHWFQVVNPKDH
jgi:catechol 2,3-dioxygenase-like lactoylglutathione lyase family enzyme